MVARLARLAAALAAVAAAAAAGCGRPGPTSLAIGTAAPAFSLPGTDGRQHALADFAQQRVLAIVFTCNSCPASQQYEARLRRIDQDYRGRGLALVAINPNNPQSFQPTDLSHTDVGESLDDMKTRAAFSHLDFPYLSDGETQALTRQFGVSALPQIFVFDQARTLRYEGRIDDNPREDLVTSRDARNAIDALLGGAPVPVKTTAAVGCAPKLLSEAGAASADVAGASPPISVEMVGADKLKALRQNGTGKLLLVNFWATWCAPCITEFPDLETTYRMYHGRGLEFTAVSVNDPAERPAVVAFLQKQHASHRTVQFATPDTYDLQAAFDKNLPAPVPFTLLLAPNGDVLYQELGPAEMPKLRRAILANLPEDAASAGQHAYWSQP